MSESPCGDLCLRLHISNITQLVAESADLGQPHERPGVELERPERESGPTIDVNAIGDGGLALGPFQFHARTFMWLSKISGLGYELRDVADVEAQADVAGWAFAHGWAHLWSCAR